VLWQQQACRLPRVGVPRLTCEGWAFEFSDLLAERCHSLDVGAWSQPHVCQALLGRRRLVPAWRHDSPAVGAPSRREVGRVVWLCFWTFSDLASVRRPCSRWVGAVARASECPPALAHCCGMSVAVKPTPFLAASCFRYWSLCGRRRHRSCKSAKTSWSCRADMHAWESS